MILSRVLGMRRFLWTATRVLWAAAVLSYLLPGIANAAVAEVGDVRFSFGQVLTLLAVAAAWGDQRSTQLAHGKRLERIENHLWPVKKGE